jgi:hypothetical protein
MDSVPLKATDVLTTKQKLPGDGDLHGRLTTHAESRRSKTATKIKFVAVNVSINQRTLIQTLAGPRARQQKGAFMNTNSRIPLPALSAPKTPIAPLFTIGSAQ